MDEFIRHKASNVAYFIILLLPFGLVASVVEQLNWIPRWLEMGGLLLAVVYFVYASMWSHKAATRHVFEHRPFGFALVEARVLLNVDIKVKLSFLPIVGSLFTLDDDKDVWKKRK
jgi:hypothetical protein